MRTAPRLVSVFVAAVAALLLARSAGADDVDDGMQAVRAEFGALKQDEFEKIFGDRMAKLRQLAFRDQEYCVAASVAKETGWSAPDKLFVFKPSTAAGPVFWATWSSGKKAEAQPTVAIVVTRLLHSDGKAPLTTKFGDVDVAHSDVFALVQAVSRQWAAGLEKPPTPADPAAAAADPAAKEAQADREACVEAVKKAVGAGKVFAAFQGRLAATKKRERREWFGWSSDDATWVTCVRYDETVLGKTNGALTKGAYFMGNVHAYKGVSAK